MEKGFCPGHGSNACRPISLIVALVLQLISIGFCQTVLYNSLPFSALLGHDGGVQLNVSADVTPDEIAISGSFIINGQTDVWISLPAYSGVVRLEGGSRVQLSNMGINFSLSGSLDLPSVLTPSFFDVDPAAALELRNVSVNTDCSILYALRNNLCNRMPDQDFEVGLWSLRVVNLATATLVAQNVTLRCGFSATNSTVTYTLMGGDRPLSDGSALDLETTATMTIPCVSLRVTSYADFRNVFASHPNVQPQAYFVFVLANVTGDLPSLYASKILVPKKRVSILIMGRPDVPTQFDLRYMTATISLSDIITDASAPSRVEVRDLTLVNMEYGPSAQYPLSLVKAALWFLEYPRADSIYTRSAVRVSLTGVILVVSDTELWWWRGLVENALHTNATDVDGGSLIEYFAPGLAVVPEDGSIWVPYWEWAHGTTNWTNCSLTATPLAYTAPLMYSARSDLLSTLVPYGQSEPVPLSAIRVTQQQLDASTLTSGPTIMLPYGTQLSTSLASSRPTLGANLTLWGEPRGVRFLDLIGLSGAVTVPPYTVLTLRFLHLVNLGVGRRGAEPAVLQNYTLMLWAFNRTLLAGSGLSSRRALLSSSATSKNVAFVEDASRPLPPLNSWRRAKTPHWQIDQLLHSRAKISQQLEPAVERSPVLDRRSMSGATFRRYLLQVATNGNSGGGSISPTGSSVTIPLGPLRTWLKLEEVVLYLPTLEFQLLYELVTSNRTSLAVSPDVVDWLRRVLETAKVTRASPTTMAFSFLTWMGVEAVDVTLSKLASVEVQVLQPAGSILVSGSPRVPPTPSSLLPPPPGLAGPLPAASPPSPHSKNTASVAYQPSGGPGAAAVPKEVQETSGNSISSVVGPAVGSAAGLLLLCGLVTFAVMYVRHRRRLSQAADLSKAKYLCTAADVDGGTGDEGRTPSRTTIGCRSSTEPNEVTIPPPPLPPGPGAGPAAAVKAPRAGQGAGKRKEAAQSEIQPATEEDVRCGNGSAAVAAAGSNGRPASPQPPRPQGQRRSRESILASGRGQGSRGPTAVEGVGSGANGGPGLSGHPPPSQQQQVRRSRWSASAASASSASKSAAGSSGIASDTAPSNPRTELYAALAVFQTELGEHQQQIAIISQLGAGAHGVVYRGEWRGLEVAVKTLLFQAFLGSNGEEGGNSLKEQAMLEAAIATTLFHPNVINTYSYDIKPLRMCQAPASSIHSSRAETVVSSDGGGIMDWKLYIIQEYCDGGTLKDALDGSRFTNPEMGMSYRETAVRVAIEIASGMSYIHNRNIIHGDLKPANILLRSNSSSPYGYTVKIADFGLALKLKAGESHISNIRRGTPFYIASELVEDGRATTASDLYSFGVILWELLHGSTVARRLPLRRRIPNLPAEFYTWPPDCPTAYRDLATACLSSNPASRPRFSQALEALTGVLQSLLEAKRKEQHRRLEERRRLAAAETVKATEQQGKGRGQGHEQEDARDFGAQDAEEKVVVADGGAASGETVSQSSLVPPPFPLVAAVRQAEVPNRKDLQVRKDQPDGSGSGKRRVAGPSGSMAQQGGGDNRTAMLPNAGGIVAVGERPESVEPASAAAAATADQGDIGVAAMVAPADSAAAPAWTVQHREPHANGGAMRPRHAEQAATGTGAQAGSEAEGAAVAAWGAGPAVRPQEYVPFGTSRGVGTFAVVHRGQGGDLLPVNGGGRPGSDAVALGQPKGDVSHSHQEQQAMCPSCPADVGGPQSGVTGVLEGVFPAAGTANTAVGPVAIGDARKAPWDVALYAERACNRHADALHYPDSFGANTDADGIGDRREAHPLVIPGARSSATTQLKPSAPLTPAAAAAALAALAASINNTSTLDMDTAGMLDSCLGSTEAHAMDHGLMLDLMPALSNQVHSSRLNSALNPELAAALENMLRAQGIFIEGAPGVEPGGVAGSESGTF